MDVHLETIRKYYKDLGSAEKDFKKLGAFSEEDKRLFTWLRQHEEIWEVLPIIFYNRLGTRFAFDHWLDEASQQNFDLNDRQRAAGAFFVLLELREYAGHSLHNLFREPPHYEDLVRCVHKRVAKQLKKPWMDASNVSSQERMLSEILLGESIAQLGPEDLRQVLEESGFTSESDFNVIKNSFAQLVLGSSLQGIETIVGKGMAKKAVLKIVEMGLKKRALDFSVRQVSKRLVSKLPGVLGKRLGLYLGLGFLAKDAYDLGSEATRITNPAVISIALFRTLST